MSCRTLSLALLLVLSPWGAQGAAAGSDDQALRSVLAAKGAAYRPRTSHLRKDGQPLYINRLIREDSPYLLQHAHNPVNWYSWGEEAFAAARRENKPIFLSIGYSTCHWCHVMERESFEDLDVARLLNQRFIAIKVDREQRPDLDARYMDAVVLMSGSGGWPMSSFLSAEGLPFFGGTYYPRDAFLRLLERTHEIWQSRRLELEAQGARVMAEIDRRSVARDRVVTLGRESIVAGVEQLLGRYDELQGGFGEAPKFPNETQLLLLLQQLERSPTGTIAMPLWHTLDAMAAGGIHDQIGGGFHRYAIDNGWLVPHFEKMLYTQALLARVYLHAWRLSGRPEYARVTRQILDYLLRDMRSVDGTFYSASDADSEGEEGRFYTWRREEIATLLPRAMASEAMALFGVTVAGNFEGRNILHLPVAIDEYAVLQKLDKKRLLQTVDTLRERLYMARATRPQPLRDEKVITAWNGLVVTVLAEAGERLREPRYLEAATLAAETLWQRTHQRNGRVWRISLGAKQAIHGMAEDYLYLAEAMLTLFDITEAQQWLDRAVQLVDAVIVRLWDEPQGGFFMAEATPLTRGIGRTKSAEDSPLPAANGVAHILLHRLFLRTGHERYRELATRTLNPFTAAISREPTQHATVLFALDEALRGEWGLRRYLARGNLKAVLTTAENEAGIATWRLDMSLKPGWHINSHHPRQSELVATRVELAVNGIEPLRVDYPEPSIKRLGFIREPLALYDGEVTIRGELPSRQLAKGQPVTLTLELQACSDEVCLAPEKIAFVMPMYP